MIRVTNSAKEGIPMAYSDIIYDKQNHIATITLNRPERLNALSKNLQLESVAVCEEARNDDDVWAVIVTGAGRGFCSGADLSGPAPVATEGAKAESAQNKILDQYSWVGDQARAFYGLDKPTIAAMNGVCAGAGMSMALACDLRVGSENSRFRTVFIERNLSPDSGMSWLLTRIVGYSRAMDLILTSRDVAADEAYRLGLLDRLVPHENLMAESVALAESITRWPPVALRAAKRVTQQNLLNNLDDGLRNEFLHLSYGRGAANDSREAMAARVEKRTPKYTGT